MPRKATKRSRRNYWKSKERDGAAMYGSKRRWLSRGDKTCNDIQDAWISPDSKQLVRKAYPVRVDFKTSIKSEKRWVVEKEDLLKILDEADSYGEFGALQFWFYGDAVPYVMIRAQDYVDLLNFYVARAGGENGKSIKYLKEFCAAGVHGKVGEGRVVGEEVGRVESGAPEVSVAKTQGKFRGRVQRVGVAKPVVG